MSDKSIELTPEKLQTNEGVNELNRILNDLLRDSGTTGEFFFNVNEGLKLTIASGVVTATHSRHSIDTESAGATDDLDTINGGKEGDILIINASDSTHTVVVKDATGNISCAGDFSMDHADDRIGLIHNGTNWIELFRSSNA